jgi:hypothetical protein
MEYAWALEKTVPGLGCSQCAERIRYVLDNCRPQQIRVTPHGGEEALSREAGKVEVMPLIQLVEVLIVVGVLLWLVNRFIPMQATIKSILNVVVVIAVVLWILNVSGLLHSFSGIRIGK